ncbi:MAG: polysaccharide deacetylase family protein [Anaerolineales bacterium]|nr:polysaccharide deacetylase family protein [Anaerolineales bacterium]
MPILMYHYVEPLPDDADELRVGLTVQPGIFRQQLAYLHARGYRSVSLHDLLYHLAIGKTLPEKPIVFTFDDGYRGLYKYAFPHMQAFGYSGTVFLVTGLMDEVHPAYLTWEMARELFTAGWQLQPHSKTHVQLSDRPFELIEYQVLGSMQTLQAHIGRQPRFFSYPSGRYDQHVIDYLAALGFWGAVTTEYGVQHDLAGAFTWKRVRVPGGGSLSDLAKYLGEETSH